MRDPCVRARVRVCVDACELGIIRNSKVFICETATKGSWDVVRVRITVQQSTIAQL